VHAGQRADDFQVAEFLGSDIHQQVLAPWIVAIRPWILYCIAAASSPFAPPMLLSSKRAVVNPRARPRPGRTLV
jgi:hypothetical protein